MKLYMLSVKFFWDDKTAPDEKRPLGREFMEAEERGYYDGIKEEIRDFAQSNGFEGDLDSITHLAPTGIMMIKCTPRFHQALKIAIKNADFSQIEDVSEKIPALKSKSEQENKR